MHQARRLAAWAARTGTWAPPVRASTLGFDHLHHHVRVPIGRRDEAAHPVFEAGKRHNLALAAPAFDGVVVPADRPLSFWRTLGRITAARGYRAGMELSGGCIVPAIGGGVCLLSNALFEAAVRLGWRIDERHGHSREAVPLRWRASFSKMPTLEGVPTWPCRRAGPSQPPAWVRWVAT